MKLIVINLYHMVKIKTT